MGSTYLSVSFLTGDAAAVIGAVKKLAKKPGAAALVANSKKGWVTVFPSQELVSDDLMARVAKACGSQHEILLSLIDGDVLAYWYSHSGELQDHYNSCPDYFGDEGEEELDARGDPKAFKGLLDASEQRKLAKILKPRMINGKEVGGAMPDAEEDRFVAITKLLGIVGADSSYDYLQAGEKVSGLGSAKDMTRVSRK